jgi:LacI family transcriptional regulator
MVSIKDIAKAVGVSPSAVSFTLNGKAKQKRISDDLSDRIIKTAEAMGYHPNRVAVGLRTGKSKTIGLIVENISNNFFSTLAKTIEDEARKFGYNVVFCSTENDAAKGSELIQLLYNQQVDGYLITPAKGMEADIKKLLSHKKPVVLMDRYFKDVNAPYVLVDNYSGMKEGIEYLISSGFKKIGFVTIDMDLQQIKERTRAFQDALSEHNIKLKKADILRLNYHHTKQESIALIKRFIKQQKDLEVIDFATNYLGIYGLQGIKELKLTIPHDIHVMSFDDHDIFELYSPGITVIKQPVESIARNAVDILIGELGHTNTAESPKIQLKTELIIRGSA